jgi:hypothetical protein
MRLCHEGPNGCGAAAGSAELDAESESSVAKAVATAWSAGTANSAARTVFSSRASS